MVIKAKQKSGSVFTSLLTKHLLKAGSRRAARPLQTSWVFFFLLGISIASFPVRNKTPHISVCSEGLSFCDFPSTCQDTTVFSVKQTDFQQEKRKCRRSSFLKINKSEVSLVCALSLRRKSGSKWKPRGEKFIFSKCLFWLSVQLPGEDRTCQQFSLLFFSF